MIKFFRNIRQQLLTENKTGKYFKYAIGEIVLVVIGILIALQINNWNEIRKIEYKERYVLGQFEKEFINDSINLNRYIFLTHQKMINAKKLKLAIEKKRYDMGLDTLVRYSFFNGRLVLFDAFMPTFDEILSSGNLSILQDEALKNLIMGYKSRNEGVKSFLYEQSQKLKDAYNGHLYKYFEPEIMTYLWENAPKRTISMDSITKFRTDVQGFFDDPQTMYHVNNGIGVDRELYWTYKERVMPSIESILAEIRKALKQYQ